MMATASRRCMVFKCGKTSKDRNLSFHSFPKREEVREQWFVMIKSGQPGWTIPKSSNSKYYAICSRHFEKSCFRTMKHKYDLASRNTLKPDAVPTLFMSGPGGRALNASIPQPKVKSEPEQSITYNVDNDMSDQSVNDCKEEADSPASLSSRSNPPESTEERSLSLLPSASTESPFNSGYDDKTPKRYALASRRCMVLGCGSTSKDRSLSFHAFPKKPELREEWLLKIRVSRPNWSSPNWPESNYYAICSRHFESNCFKTMKHNFSSTSRNTLRPDAVPTLYLDDSEQTVDYKSLCMQLPTLNGRTESSNFQPQNFFHYPVTSQEMPDGNDVCETQHSSEQEKNHVFSPPVLYKSYGSTSEDQIEDSPSENGKWSPGNLSCANTSTQTDILTKPQPVQKQTRTVRIQTLITVKKAVESKGTQSDFLKEVEDRSTQYEDCSGSQTSSEELRVRSPNQISFGTSLPEFSETANLDLFKQSSNAEPDEPDANSSNVADLRLCLLSLFKSCPLCTSSSTAKVLKSSGTVLTIHQHCQNNVCNFEQVWANESVNGLNNCKQQASNSTSIS